MNLKSHGFKTAPLLLALLAACGGSDGGPDTATAPVSKQENASPTTLAAAPADASEIERVILKDVLPLDDGTVSAGDTHARRAPGVGLSSIRSELLATMLLQSGSSEAAPWVGLPQLGYQNPAPNAPLVSAAQALASSDQQAHVLRSSSEMWKGVTGNGAGVALYYLPFFGSTSADGKFTQLSLDIPLEATGNHLSSADGLDPKALGTLAAGTPYLALNQALQLSRGVVTMPHFDSFNNGFWMEPATMSGVSLTPRRADFSLKAGERVSLYRVLQQWQGADSSQYVQLLTMRGLRSDQIRLCLNVRLPDVRRLSCSSWQVPADWKPGAPLNYLGHYVVDDRSVHEGFSGMRYWNTPVISTTHRPVRGAGGAAVAAISTQGVSGDVLATMLTQDAGQTVLREATTAGPDAASIDGSRVRPLWVDKHVSFTPPTQTPDFSRSLWVEQASSINANFFTLPWITFRNIGLQMHLTANLGSFGKESFSLSGQDAMPTGTSILSLGHNAYSSVSVLMLSDRDRRHYPTVQALSPARNVQIRKGVQLAYDQSIQRWSALDGTQATLSVHRGRGDDEAWMCTRVQKAQVHDRRTCTIWGVPADWKLGNPLIYRGAHVTDDRSFANGSGNTFWLGLAD